MTYDAAGNTTDDGTTSYTYDAEGRVVTATNTASGTSSYVYDAEGRRAEKTTSAGGTVDFLYDLQNHEILQVNSSGIVTRDEIYAGGRHLATYVNDSTYFNHADWLGTERVRSALNDTAAETCTSLPFGDWLNCGGGTDLSPMHFTGKEHDWETSLENFGARYDSSTMGRFMTPDWAARPATVPYASFGDPQTLNLYAYVENEPLNRVDADGHTPGGSPDNAPGCDGNSSTPCQDIHSEHPSAQDENKAQQHKKQLDLRQDIVTRRRVPLRCNRQCQEAEEAAWAKLIADLGMFAAMGTGGEGDSAAEEGEVEAQILEEKAEADAASGGFSSKWGRNRLVKELQDRGFALEKPTNSGDGLIYKNAETGEEVRIMPRPDRAPFRTEPSAKFESGSYYRYRSGPDQPWGPPVSIPDK